jgi:hypothetical protein
MKVTQTKDGKNILDLNEDYYTSVDEDELSPNGA